MPLTPEQKAREEIDKQLQAAGWIVQDMDELQIEAGRGVAVREFRLKQGHGTADYLLYVDQRVAGVIEAKREGVTLTGVELQSEKYSTGLENWTPAWHHPLPFMYQATGSEIQFTNALDPDPRSRPLFWFHQISCLCSLY